MRFRSPGRAGQALRFLRSATDAPAGGEGVRCAKGSPESTWRCSVMADIRQLPANDSTDALFVTVYARLKAMAARQLPNRHNATQDTTELVHALYLRIGQREALGFGQDREGN